MVNLPFSSVLPDAQCPSANALVAKSAIAIAETIIFFDILKTFFVVEFIYNNTSKKGV